LHTAGAALQKEDIYNLFPTTIRMSQTCQQQISFSISLQPSLGLPLMDFTGASFAQMIGVLG
jgi:hypothetical protein